jgi:hypothetical protein
MFDYSVFDLYYIQGKQVEQFRISKYINLLLQVESDEMEHQVVKHSSMDSDYFVVSNYFVAEQDRMMEQDKMVEQVDNLLE